MKLFGLYKSQFHFLTRFRPKLQFLSLPSTFPLQPQHIEGTSNIVLWCRQSCHIKSIQQQCLFADTVSLQVWIIQSTSFSQWLFLYVMCWCCELHMEISVTFTFIMGGDGTPNRHEPNSNPYLEKNSNSRKWAQIKCKWMQTITIMQILWVVLEEKKTANSPVGSHYTVKQID